MGALTEELDHFGGEEVFVLLEELVGVVVDFPGEVAHREVETLGFGLDVVLGLDVIVELVWGTLRKRMRKKCGKGRGIELYVPPLPKMKYLSGERKGKVENRLV